MLEDIRVLEISSPETMLAGSNLAALGADVIVIEPPSGAVGRRLEPFLDDLPGIERSLTWQAMNRNKRAITLDLASIDGQQLFAQLADGGTITTPLGMQPWGDYYGKVTDQFGVQWMLNCPIRSRPLQA